MLGLIKLILLLIIAILGAAFASINADIITVNYYFDTMELPLGVLIFLLLGLGTIIGAIGAMSMLVRIKSENISLRRHARQADDEVKNLRSLPDKGIST